MPLVGVICDANGKPYSFEECLACAKQRGPRRCNNAYQVIKAMSLNASEQFGDTIRVTRLLDLCSRRAILSAEVPYHEKPSKVYPRVRGTVHHLLFETFSDGLEPYIAEVRFRKSVEIDGCTIWVTGKCDLLLLDEPLSDGPTRMGRAYIVDAKSIGDINSSYKTVKSGKAQAEHVQQVNLYAWLVWGGTVDEDAPQFSLHKGDRVMIEVYGGEIQYMDMSEQMKISVPIWPMEEIDAFVRERLRPFVEYRQRGVLPPFLTNLWGERHVFCNSCPLKSACDSL